MYPEQKMGGVSSGLAVGASKPKSQVETSFKVGDRIKNIDPNSETFGQKGIVVCVRGSADGHVYVKYDSDLYGVALDFTASSTYKKLCECCCCE